MPAEAIDYYHIIGPIIEGCVDTVCFVLKMFYREIERRAFHNALVLSTDINDGL